MVFIRNSKLLGAHLLVNIANDNHRAVEDIEHCLNRHSVGTMRIVYVIANIVLPIIWKTVWVVQRTALSIVAII